MIKDLTLHSSPVIDSSSWQQQSLLPGLLCNSILQLRHETFPFCAREAINFVTHVSEASQLCALINGNATNQDRSVYRHLSLFGMLCRGEFGAIHADLVGVRDKREDVWKISALSLGIISVIDDIIDENFYSTNKRVQLVEAALGAICNHTELSSDDSKLERIERASHVLHQQVMRAPRADVFFGQFEKVARAAVEQIQEAGSFEISKRVGGETCALGATIPAIFLDQPPEKLMRAAWHLGAIVQLADDLNDWQHDRSLTIQTGAAALSRFEDAFEQTWKHIDSHFAVLDGLLNADERRCYGALLSLGGIKWPLLSGLSHRLFIGTGY